MMTNLETYTMEPVSFNASQVLISLLTDYGTLGMALFTVIYFLNEIKTKMNLLLEMNNRVFGLLISLVDKQQRDAETIRLNSETKIGKGEK